MRKQPDDAVEAAIAQQAAEWIARRDRGLSPREAQAFEEWRRADPRHAAELRRLRATWQALDVVAADPELNTMADEVIAHARVERLQRRRAAFAALLVAAAAALVVGVGAWLKFDGGEQAAVAYRSENVKVLDSTVRRLSLPDGSVAELNGSSRIELDFTPVERRVRLTAGEAHFIVAKNPDRPFLVTAGAVTVRAVGTAFDVRLAAAAVEVLVTEGKVQVQQHSAAAATGNGASAHPEPAALVAGQRAVIEHSPAGAPAVVAIGDVDRAAIDEALGWQSTRLVFNNTPLDEVVASFNRFNTHQLALGDPKLRRRMLTGVFRADNLDGFVRLLRASIDVKAESRNANETVLLPLR